MSEAEFQTNRATSKLPEPGGRPWKQRTASRVVVVADECVLLFEDSDPGLPEFRWWVTPGGGIDPGETPHQAAVRELAEETGLETTVEALIGPVAHRVTLHGYSDQVLEQEEHFFVLHTDRFDVSTAGHTIDEQLTLQSHRWWPISELATTQAWIWPQNVLQIMAADPSKPLELGRTVVESTLAV